MVEWCLPYWKPKYKYSPAVEAGDWQMCCQTGLVALLFGSSVIQEILDVGRMHYGKEYSRNMKQRQRKAIRGTERETFLLLLFSKGISQLLKILSSKQAVPCSPPWKWKCQAAVSISVWGRLDLSVQHRASSAGTELGGVRGTITIIKTHLCISRWTLLRVFQSNLLVLEGVSSSF